MVLCVFLLCYPRSHATMLTHPHTPIPHICSRNHRNNIRAASTNLVRPCVVCLYGHCTRAGISLVVTPSRPSFSVRTVFCSTDRRFATRIALSFVCVRVLRGRASACQFDEFADIHMYGSSILVMPSASVCPGSSLPFWCVACCRMQRGMLSFSSLRFCDAQQ